MKTTTRPAARTRLVTLFLLTALAGLVSPSMGHAAYALADVSVSAFVATRGGTAISEANPTYGITHTGVFSGFGQNQMMSSSPGGPLDLGQIFIGPAAPPPENTLTPLGPGYGQYARSDSIVTTISSPPIISSFDLIAETNRSSVGIGAARNEVSYSFTSPVVTGDSVTVFFMGGVDLIAQADAGGGAAAVTSVVAALFDGSDNLLVAFTPVGDPLRSLNVQRGSVNNVSDPMSLNRIITAPPNDSYSSGLGTYRFTYTVPSNVDSVRVQLFLQASAAVAIPEPSGVVLLGLGALVLTGRYRPRRKAA